MIYQPANCIHAGCCLALGRIYLRCDLLSLSDVVSCAVCAGALTLMSLVMNFICSTIVVVCSVVIATPAQQESAAMTVGLRREVEDLNALLVPIRERHKMPALGAAVIVKGKLVALGVDGIRKVGDEATVTTQDLWHLGSCTKAMTATLIAQQVAEGKLQWTSSLGEVLPDLRDGMHESARKITVAQLLQHRSGLPAQPPAAQWVSLFSFDGSNLEARREVAQTMLKSQPEVPPGERFQYSNAGYMIAGAALERATGKTWQQLMQARLFDVLGMSSAGFGAPGHGQKVEQPWGHITVDMIDKPMFADNPPSLGPAGTVHASLEDWARFIELHLGVVPEVGKPVCSESSLATLHQPPEGGDYALGWVVTKRDWADGPILWHNGSNTLWYAVTWMAPDMGFAVLVTCNHGGGSKACDEVAGACIKRFSK